MTTLLTDLRFGLRMLWKSPAMTVIALVALTLGIGANTAIFSVVNAVLLRTFPYADPEKLVLVWEKRQGGRTDQNVINLGNFTDWKEQNQVFSDMAVFFDRSFNLTSDGEPEEVPGSYGTTNFFSVLGTNASLGRTFVDSDGVEGQPSVVVISYGLWQRRFGGDTNVVGRQITLNERPTTIIGVMPPSFGWHIQKGTQVSKPADMWLPFQITNDLRRRRGRFASAVARLKPGVTMDQARSEMDTIGARLWQQYPEFNTNWGVNVVPLRTQFTGEIRRPLLILLGAVGFVLLIACANVANLLLARASSRRKEIAVRAGLGASRWRIARQLLTESVLLSLIGGTLGVLVAWWGTRALVALSPPALIDLQRVSVSWPVLAFTLGLSLLTGIVFGLVPAFEATRFDLNDSLKEGGKNIGGSVSGHRVRSLFVVTQVALALVLLVGAGLLLKSFNRLQSVDPGFNPGNLLTMRVSLPLGKYGSEPKRIEFFQRAVDQMKTIPGVESVGAINTPPFTGLYSGTTVEVDGQKLPAGQELKTGVCVTDANYFQTMQIPLKRGRLYTQQEATELRHVVLVNEEFVRKNLGGQDPLAEADDLHERGQRPDRDHRRRRRSQTSRAGRCRRAGRVLAISGVGLSGHDADAAHANGWRFGGYCRARRHSQSRSTTTDWRSQHDGEPALDFGSEIAIQRIAVDCLFYRRPCDGGGRNLRRDVLFRPATNTRDRYPHGARRATLRRVEADGAERSGAGSDRSRCRTRGFICPDATHLDVVV